ncbi:MAG: hypothetical protein PHY86_03150 [Candidatus Gracilibacteria bacterium]|nr:hypothetical protein [Candidatus Gracilibacteria bacterium]
MKTTKAKRKVAQRKPKQKVSTKPKRSFLAMFGFILLGVIIGMVTIQAVESRWLRSDLAQGVATSSGRDCGGYITNVDDCSGCCTSANAMDGATSAEIKICAISCGTAYNNNLENTNGNAAQQKAAEEVQTKTEADFAQTYMSGTSAAATTSTASAAKPTTTASGTVYPSKAECEKAGCKSCVLKPAATGSTAASSSGGSAAAGGTDADGQAGYEAAQNCMSHADNDIEGCKSCCADQDLNTFALSSCRENCVAPDATDSASEAAGGGSDSLSENSPECKSALAEVKAFTDEKNAKLEQLHVDTEARNEKLSVEVATLSQQWKNGSISKEEFTQKNQVIIDELEAKSKELGEAEAQAREDLATADKEISRVKKEVCGITE